MRIANTAYFFPWWALLLLALLPPAMAAAAAFPLRRFIPDSGPVLDARTKLIALGVSAYTFTVAFSVNTLWDQDTTLGEATLYFDYSVSALQDAARDHADDLPADIDQKIEALRQPDVILDAVSFSPRQNDAFGLAWDEVTDAFDDAPAAVGIALKPHAEEAQRSFVKMAHSNTLGVPGIILIVIVLLGMVLSGVMAAAPRSARLTRKEAVAVECLMFAGILIISLMQWALWVLNSRDFVLSMILPTLAGEFRTLNAYHVAVAALVLVVPLLVILGAAFVLQTRSRQSAEDEAPDG